MSKFKFLCLVTLVSFQSQQSSAKPLTSAETNSTISCPSGLLWSNQTTACYQLNSRGPCGELMLFVKDPDDPTSPFGRCVCDESVVMPRTNNTCSYRPKIYWKPHGRCYRAFSEGPCKPGEWFTITNSSSGYMDEAICEVRLCQRLEFNDEDDENFWFGLGGSCFLTGSRGFCRRSYQRIYFQKNSFTPICFPQNVCIGNVLNLNTGDMCPAERDRHYVGRCRRKQTFSLPSFGESVDTKYNTTS